MSSRTHTRADEQRRQTTGDRRSAAAAPFCPLLLPPLSSEFEFALRSPSSLVPRRLTKHRTSQASSSAPHLEGRSDVALCLIVDRSSPCSSAVHGIQLVTVACMVAMYRRHPTNGTDAHRQQFLDLLQHHHGAPTPAISPFPFQQQLTLRLRKESRTMRVSGRLCQSLGCAS
jgi:hypothetical protein